MLGVDNAAKTDPCRHCDKVPARVGGDLNLYSLDSYK